MVQFPVPKNIDLEDKLIGPMSLRQFLYVLIGGTIAYTIFQKVGGPTGNNSLAALIGLPIAVFSLALAFLKIQERPFGDFLISLIIYFVRPRQRIWQRQQQNEQKLVVDENKQKEQRMATKKAINVQELSDLTKILDSDGETKE